MLRPQMQLLPRCCPSHRDFETLTRHLTSDFPELSDLEVATQVVFAANAVRKFGLEAADAVEMAELISRNRLSLATGRLEDVARLDPQCHPSRGASRLAAAG